VGAWRTRWFVGLKRGDAGSVEVPIDPSDAGASPSLCGAADENDDECERVYTPPALVGATQ
jgi:hypothetical protein